MSHYRTGLLLDDIFRAHDTGAGHPECPERYVAITGALTKQGITDEAIALTQRPAEPDDVLLCHTRSYFETAKQDISAGAHELSTGDTQVCAKSFDIALRAVGGVMNAVDEVMSGKIRNAFCAVRPPGHHATRDESMGFCMVSNVAVAAASLADRGERVLILDYDAHHGNGTQDIFMRTAASCSSARTSRRGIPLPVMRKSTARARGAVARSMLHCLQVRA